MFAIRENKILINSCLTPFTHLQSAAIINALGSGPLSAAELVNKLGLKSKTGALNSRLQKYRLTEKGRKALNRTHFHAPRVFYARRAYFHALRISELNNRAKIMFKKRNRIEQSTSDVWVSLLSGFRSLSSAVCRLFRDRARMFFERKILSRENIQLVVEAQRRGVNQGSIIHGFNRL